MNSFALVAGFDVWLDIEGAEEGKDNRREEDAEKHDEGRELATRHKKDS